MLPVHSSCPSPLIIEVDYSLKLGAFACEPEDFLNSYDGRIIDADTGLLVGRIRAIVACIDEAFNHNMSLIDVLDGSSHTEPYMSLYAVDGGGYTADVQRMLRDADMRLSFDLLVLDRLEILPQYRGQRLGLAALDMTIRTLGRHCTLAALTALPLQFSCLKDTLLDMDLHHFIAGACQIFCV